MAKTNVKREPVRTHEGAVACRVGANEELRRAVMPCMLWEDQFYESGEDIAKRIKDLISQVEPEQVASIAIEAREKMKLRHVPLLIVREMARLKTHRGLVSSTLFRVIQRADELTEFVSIYWKKKKQPLAAQVKKGLALAFTKFNEHSLAKYNRNGAIKLRDVLFLCHAKPINVEQGILWKKLIDNTLATPDTWEVALSTGQNKKEAWERLISEKKLGALAMLRNLRNMYDAKVDKKLIFQGLAELETERVLPFRFISAARHAPQWEPEIEQAMLKSLEGREKFKGTTALVVDGSGSMFGTKVSAKSEMDRFEAACALAILARESCENCHIIIFGDQASLVPARRGFALRDALAQQAQRGGTNIQMGVNKAQEYGYDRIIILTDEQSASPCSNPLPGTKGYIINVASYQHGVGYGAYTHIDGWSEAVLDYIMEVEKHGAA